MGKRRKTPPAARRPSRQTLTVMFIDVAGFSLAVEDLDPVDAFHSLKELIAMMRATIRRHGGIVDKVLGDGLLCYFGYQPDAGASTPEQVASHAEAALLCASELQRQGAEECLKAAEQGRPIFPIRIGLNTALVFAGDLGDDDREDFTVIGDGVNYAKRIEDSCDVFMIMMSGTMKDALAPTSSAPLVKRGIQIKHHDRVFDVYEFNPFVGKEALLTKARQLYQTFRGAYRQEERYLFSKDAPFEVHSDYGDCTLVDISLGGFQVRLSRYLARGVQVKLAITPKKQDRKAQYLNLIGLTTLNCLVKWGRPGIDGHYYHGLELLNLTKEQKDIIFSLLKTYCIATEPASAS